MVAKRSIYVTRTAAYILNELLKLACRDKKARINGYELTEKINESADPPVNYQTVLRQLKRLQEAGFVEMREVVANGRRQKMVRLAPSKRSEANTLLLEYTERILARGKRETVDRPASSNKPPTYRPEKTPSRVA